MNSDIFLQAIELKPTVAEVFDEAYTAVPQYVPWPKAYGGDMVAQGALAMMRSTSEDRGLHSMHSYFLRPVDVGIPVRYEVELLRDGRGYSTRQVRGFQNGKPVYAALGSFHVPENGPAYEPDMPQAYAGIDPETLSSAAEVLEGRDADDARYWSTGRSFDMRHVPGPLYLETGNGVAAHQGVWIKAFSKLPDDVSVHRAALAYVCDYTILEPLLRAHGLAWTTPGLTTASLDHAMWFHRDGRVDDWVLYAQDAVSSQNNRGLAAGRFFTRDGTLLATVAQEGMIRGPRT